jgi:hypothetical protein
MQLSDVAERSRQTLLLLLLLRLLDQLAVLFQTALLRNVLAPTVTVLGLESSAPLWLLFKVLQPPSLHRPRMKGRRQNGNAWPRMLRDDSGTQQPRLQRLQLLLPLVARRTVRVDAAAADVCRYKAATLTTCRAAARRAITPLTRAPRPKA